MAHIKKSSPKKKSKQLLSKETLVARKERGIKNTTEDLTQKIYLNVQYRDKEFAKFYGAKFDWDRDNLVSRICTTYYFYFEIRA